MRAGSGLLLAMAVAVAVPTLSRGGFDSSSRSLFVVLAGAALLLAGTVDARAAARAARSPVAMTLFALAALSLVSSAWTVGSRSDALRWGLVIGGYGAVFIVAATAARATGPWPVAAGVALLAIAEAMLGLRAVAFHALPDAERLSGVWQPGGTFEYTPALTILEVGALPILSVAADHRRPTIAGGAAAAAILAGAVLGLTGSRLAPALAVALLLFMIVRPPTGPRARPAAIATTAFVLIGVLLAPVLLGGKIGAHTPGTGAVGAAEVTGLAAAAAAAWPLVRRLTASRTPSSIAAAICVATVALAATASITAEQGAHATRRALAIGPVRVNRQAARHTQRRQRVIPRVFPADRSLLHGRGYEWKAAIETWLDHPALGAGADAYFVASLRHQSVARSRFAHNLPLELAAELGTLGLLLGLALYAAAAWTISHAVRGHARWLLAPIVALFMIANLVDWSWHLAGLGAIWAAAAGALNAATK